MRRPLSLAVAALLAACASPEEGRDGGPDDVYRLPAVAEAPPSATKAEGPAFAIGYRVEMRVEREGETVLSPAVVVLPGVRATFTVGEPFAYVRAWTCSAVEGPGGKPSLVAEPEVAKVPEGVTVEAAARPLDGPPGRVVLGWSVRVVRVRKPVAEGTVTLPAPAPPEGGGRQEGAGTATVQLPAVEESGASGCLVVEEGVTALLARIPEPGTGQALAFLARVVEAAVPAEAAGPLPVREGGEGAPPPSTEMLAGAPGGPGAPSPPGRFDLRLLAIDADREPGTVLDEAATAYLLNNVDYAVLRGFSLFTGMDRRVRAACVLREARLAAGEGGGSAPAERSSGLRAEAEDDGSVRVEWTTTPAWKEGAPAGSVHGARFPAARGSRLAVLARLEGGGCVAALVGWRPFAADAPADR